MRLTNFLLLFPLAEIQVGNTKYYQNALFGGNIRPQLEIEVKSDQHSCKNLTIFKYKLHTSKHKFSSKTAIFVFVLKSRAAKDTKIKKMYTQCSIKKCQG